MISFRSKAVSKLETAATSLDVTVPAGIQPGDVLLCWMYAAFSSSPGTTMAGWTLAGTRSSYGGGGYLYVYWRLVDGTEPATYPVTFTTSARVIATMTAYTGASPTTPLGGLLAAIPPGGVTTIELPAKTAGVHNAWLLTTAGERKGSDPGATHTIDEPSDAERSDDTTVGGTSGSRPGLAVYDSDGTIAHGSVNDRVVTISGSISFSTAIGWLTELISDETTGTGPLAFRGSAGGGIKGTTSVTVNLDASYVQDGDLLVAAVVRSSVSSTLTLPGGFTRMPFTHTGNSVFELWYKIANGEPSTMPFTLAGFSSQYLTVAMTAYSGANTSSPIGAWGVTQADGASVATPTITTRTAGSWIFSAIFKGSTSPGFSTTDPLDIERVELLTDPSAYGLATYDSNREYPAASSVSRTLEIASGTTGQLRLIAEIRPGIGAPSGPTVTFNEREAGGWTERTGVPKAWTGGPDWVEAPGRHWDGTTWQDLPS